MFKVEESLDVKVCLGVKYRTSSSSTVEGRERMAADCVRFRVYFSLFDRSKCSKSPNTGTYMYTCMYIYRSSECMCTCKWREGLHRINTTRIEKYSHIIYTKPPIIVPSSLTPFLTELGYIHEVLSLCGKTYVNSSLLSSSSPSLSSLSSLSLSPSLS